MKTIVKNEEFYTSARKREFEKPEEIEKFYSFMEKKDFKKMKEMLDLGFNPNSSVPIQECYSYDETKYYRLLDLCEDSPALQKLLRSYGAKTSKEIRAEREQEWQRER